MQSIFCSFQSCLTQLKLPWDPNKEVDHQPRYAQHKHCDLWCIFEGENDWNVAEIDFDSKLEDEVFTDMVDAVYVEHAQIIADSVSVGKFAALPIHGKKDEKFEVVQYQSEPYVFNSHTFRGDATEIKW